MISKRVYKFLIYSFISFLSLSISSFVSSEDLVLRTLDLNNFSLKIIGTSDQGFVIEFLGLESNNIKTEIINNPTRFVVDIPGLPSKTAYNLSVNSNNISKVRVGIHKDKTRIVFDLLLNQENLTFLKKEEKNENGQNIYKFIFTSKNNLVPSATTPPAILPSVFPTTSPSMTPIAIPSVSPSKMPSTFISTSLISASPSVSSSANLAEVIPSVSSSKLPISSPTSSAMPVASIDNRSTNFESVLKSLVFQTTSDQIQSSIVLSISPYGLHELRKVTERIYELFLPNVKLRSEILALPQYPPDSFKGYVYIAAEQKETGAIVKIMVEPNITLTSYVSQGKLWVRTN